MGFLELLLVGIGLSMDAFAVSICKGLNMKKINYSQSFFIALFFGGFQALMPLIGWFLGSQFEKYINRFDHWIAFILLAFIGGKMLYDVIRGGDGEEDEAAGATGKAFFAELTLLAIATSIDALAVGITLALLPGTNIWFSIAVIGITTFIISFSGVFIGNRFGAKYQRGAQIAGGVILIIIGLKILLEGLGIL
jgi:putative Mn2+ efflux pump MntP